MVEELFLLNSAREVGTAARWGGSADGRATLEVIVTALFVLFFLSIFLLFISFSVLSFTFFLFFPFFFCVSWFIYLFIYFTTCVCVGLYYTEIRHGVIFNRLDNGALNLI